MVSKRGAKKKFFESSSFERSSFERSFFERSFFKASFFEAVGFVVTFFRTILGFRSCCCFYFSCTNYAKFCLASYSPLVALYKITIRLCTCSFLFFFIKKNTKQ